MRDPMRERSRPLCKIRGHWSDGQSAMVPPDIDDRTVDRLLAGAVTSEDAPPGYDRVADLLQGARPQRSAGELVNEAAAVASMRAVILEQAPTPAHSRSKRKPMITQLLTAKAAILGGVLVLGTGAAAATGSLPGAAQSTASDVLAKIGISVPGANDHSAGHADTRGGSGEDGTTTSTTATTDGSSATTTGTGTGADGSADGGTATTKPATFGLCTAAAANAGHPNANAGFPSADACTNVTHPGNPGGKSETGSTEPSTTATTAAHQGGPPSSTPASGKAPVQTPNHGSAATSNPGNGHGPSNSNPGRQ